MGRAIHCPAEHWTTLFDHVFVQFPRTWTVVFRTVSAAPFTGEVRITRTSWIFPNPPELLPLEATMQFERGWWNTFYRVQIKPSHALTAQIT